MMFNPNRGLLAGVQTSALQAALKAAQQAYMDLSTGAKGESYSYTQGDGSKSVTYTKADLPALSAYIQSLQVQLGIVRRPRRAIVPRF